MKHHRFTRLTIFVFLIVISVFQLSKAQTGPNISEFTPVDADIVAFLKRWKIQGASVAIVKDGKLLYARGFGEAYAGMPTSPDHLFRIASLSKPVTSLAIFKLVEQGKLHLDDHVFGLKGILNDPIFLNIHDSSLEEITIRHLLDHTAGWDRGVNLEGDLMFAPISIALALDQPFPASSRNVIAYALSKDLDFIPGTRFAYSNLGYNVLGRVIEKVSRQGYQQFVDSCILSPLMISEMTLGKSNPADRHPLEVKYFDLPNRDAVNAAFDLTKKEKIPYGGVYLEAMDAHGGWIASAIDMAKIMLASAGQGVYQDRFLSGRNLTQQPSISNQNYVNGWCVNASGNRWHTGSLPGASSMMAYLADGTGWVLLFNGNPGTTAYFHQLDRVMWKALAKIEIWPTRDLIPAKDLVVEALEEVSQ